MRIRQVSRRHLYGTLPVLITMVSFALAVFHSRIAAFTYAKGKPRPVQRERGTVTVRQ